jgi:phage head maturation protease
LPKFGYCEFNQVLAKVLLMTMKKKVLDFSAEVKAVGADNSGEFEGYASVFGVVDCYNEVVDKGAFVESLSKNGMPKLLLQHSAMMVGGVYTEAREDRTRAVRQRHAES